MTREEFEKIIESEFERAIPEKFRPHIKNVAFLVEDESPSKDLLGLYHGVPMPERGDWYGMGTTMPDTITLYQNAIEKEASELLRLSPRPAGFEVCIRQVVRETIWHEVAHHFGWSEHEVRARESLRDSGPSV